jgi:glycosyltransferase involved in cell wall biosynthesis
MKSIVWVVTGKPSSFIEEKIKGLMAQNWEVFLITPNDNDYQHLHTPKISKKEIDRKKKSITTFFWVLFHFSWFLEVAQFFRKTRQHNRLDAMKMAVGACVLAQRKKPNLIHVQWLHETVRFTPIAKRWNIPLLASVRGSQANYYIDSTKDGMERFLLNAQYATHFHSVGKEMSEKLVSLGIPTEKITVIYNGLDRSIFKPSDSKLLDDSPVRLLTVGNFNPRKNHLAALSLMAELKKEQLGFQWTFIGEGHGEKRFQYFVQLLDLPESQVVFLKGLNAQQMANQFQKHHLMLGFSSSEGLCNSVLEAMACGCIPIVFQFTGMQELIPTDQAGSILPWGDVMEMKRELAVLMDRKVEWKKWSENAVASSMNFPSHQESTQDWIKLYQRLTEVQP